MKLTQSILLAALLAAGATVALTQDDVAVAEPAPRWPDGHVNLGSSPDHKGYWEIRPGGTQNRGGRGTPARPWAEAVAQYRGQALLHSPLVDCKAATGSSFFNSPGFEIVEVPEMEQIFILNIAGPHSWRVVYMDGREHPTGPDVRPTYLGHSVGHWEDDTLVIDTVGINEKTWISGSFPNTEQVHLVERISRPNLVTLNYDVTIEDPGSLTEAYSRGWTINESTSSSWIEGGEMFEYICQDAEAEGFGY